MASPSTGETESGGFAVPSPWIAKLMRANLRSQSIDRRDNGTRYDREPTQYSYRDTGEPGRTQYMRDTHGKRAADDRRCADESLPTVGRDHHPTSERPRPR